MLTKNSGYIRKKERHTPSGRRGKIERECHTPSGRRDIWCFLRGPLVCFIDQLLDITTFFPVGGKDKSYREHSSAPVLRTGHPLVLAAASCEWPVDVKILVKRLLDYLSALGMVGCVVSGQYYPTLKALTQRS